jgi:hypothetical protein
MASTPKGREAGRTSPLDFGGVGGFSDFFRLFFLFSAISTSACTFCAFGSAAGATICELRKLDLTRRLA